MERGTKILILVMGLVTVSGVLSVILFTQGSIIGEGEVTCEWTDMMDQDNQTFQDYEVLNESLQEYYGEGWEDVTWENWEFRKHPETGDIQNRLTGCGSEEFQEQ